MHVANQLILLGALLVVAAIVAARASARAGAPVLLVVLVLGMLVGEDGIGVQFGDFGAAYLIGSVALALILFDGGLKTRREAFALAGAPAAVLATIGVLITAGVTALAAALAFGLAPLPALLVGSMVAATDAAAVFFLMHLQGVQVAPRVAATLELESGLNDPMAVFLTVAVVGLLSAGQGRLEVGLLLDFAWQMAGGLALGLGGGLLIATAVNRLGLAEGLVPILCAMLALALFAGAQLAECSGFLAVYLAGIVVADRRRRYDQAIDRFSDAMTWLAQIVMFLMLGLLVTPSALLPMLGPALAVALALAFVARPLAVALCLAPFGYGKRETAFVAWVGLRGAVPLYLAIPPVLAGVEGAHAVFAIAFVVVLTSLVLQGWTVLATARGLRLELPAEPEPAARMDLGGGLVGYRVPAESPLVGRALTALSWPAGTRPATVLRAGAAIGPDAAGALAMDDVVLVQAPDAVLPALDRAFAAPAEEDPEIDLEAFGEFVFGADRPLDAVAGFYGFAVPEEARGLALGDALAKALGRRRPVEGDRAHVGDVELIARRVVDGAILQVGVELSPEPTGERLRAALRPSLRRWLRRISEAIGRRADRRRRGQP
jgi:cell volume regulation protein A